MTTSVIDKDLAPEIRREANRFSVRRMMMVARYYKRPIVRQLGVYSLVCVALFALLSCPFSEIVHTMFRGLASIVLMMLFYLGPLAFASEGMSRELASMLPARAGEKFGMILIYCILVVPLFLFVVWTLLWGATCWFDGAEPIWTLVDKKIFSFGDYELYGEIAAVFQDMMPMCTVLWVVLASRDVSFVKGLVAAFGSLVVLWIAGFVVGFISVAIMANQGMKCDGVADPSTMMAMLNDGTDVFFMLSFIVIACVFICYEVFALWRSYRLVAHRQV